MPVFVYFCSVTGKLIVPDIYTSNAAFNISCHKISPELLWVKHLAAVVGYNHFVDIKGEICGIAKQLE